LHVSHAPRGLLNEKSCGDGAGRRVPSFGHSKRSVKLSRAPPPRPPRRAPRGAPDGLGEDERRVAVALAERRPERVAQPRRRLGRRRQAVDDHEQLRAAGQVEPARLDVVEVQHLAVDRRRARTPARAGSRRPRRA
jgi:hypothetical protein